MKRKLESQQADSNLSRHETMEETAIFWRLEEIEGQRLFKGYPKSRTFLAQY
jgi:hypothetical protein